MLGKPLRTRRLRLMPCLDRWPHCPSQIGWLGTGIRSVLARVGTVWELLQAPMCSLTCPRAMLRARTLRTRRPETGALQSPSPAPGSHPDPRVTPDAHAGVFSRLPGPSRSLGYRWASGQSRPFPLAGNPVSTWTPPETQLPHRMVPASPGVRDRRFKALPQPTKHLS